MKLELDDFSTLNRFEKKQEKGEEQEKGQDTEELERFYQEKIAQLENQYKELLTKVSKESYEQGFADASSKFQKEMEEKITQIRQEFTLQKQRELEELKEHYINFEEEFNQKYTLYLSKFTDIVVDSMGEVLEFLFVDKANTETVKRALDKLLEDFSNYLPLSIQVNRHLYKDIKEKFTNVEVKKNEELKNNEFIIEFHDFKIENRIKEKLSVIKDEIKRETKKLT